MTPEKVAAAVRWRWGPAGVVGFRLGPGGELLYQVGQETRLSGGKAVRWEGEGASWEAALEDARRGAAVRLRALAARRRR